MNFQDLINTLKFSNLGWELITPLLFSFSDVITGYIQAVINNDVDSKKMREGLLHKSLIIMVLSLSFVVRYAFNLYYITSIVSIYIILMESVSILENLKKGGINIGKIGDILKEKTEENLNKLEDNKDKEGD